MYDNTKTYFIIILWTPGTKLYMYDTCGSMWICIPGQVHLSIELFIEVIIRDIKNLFQTAILTTFRIILR